MVYYVNCVVHQMLMDFCGLLMHKDKQKMYNLDFDGKTVKIVKYM